MTVIDPPTPRVRSRNDWQAIETRVSGDYPLAEAPPWAEACRASDDLLASILRDLIRVDYSPVQRGVRVMPDFETGLRRLADLRGELSVESFAHTFAHLSSGMSRTVLARKTRLGRSQVHRLLTGTIEPTLTEMSTIAAAFGKDPWYFREARSAMLGNAVLTHMEANPERSAILVKRMVGA